MISDEIVPHYHHARKLSSGRIHGSLLVCQTQVTLLPCSRVKAEGGDFFGYTDAEKILPDLDPSPSDIILLAGPRPALTVLHHSQVQLNHLIRRTHA